MAIEAAGFGLDEVIQYHEAQTSVQHLQHKSIPWPDLVFSVHHLILNTGIQEIILLHGYHSNTNCCLIHNDDKYHQITNIYWSLVITYSYH